MTKTSSTRAIAFLLSFALLLIALACGPAVPRTSPGHAGPTASLECAPLRTALLLDQTGSAETNGVPHLTAADLDPLLDTIERCSGEIAFGLIRDRSNIPLLRIALLDPPPARLMLEPLPANPLEAAEPEARNQAAQSKWESANQTRHQRWTAQVRAFRAQIQPLLDRQDKAGATDIAGALDRVALFLGEDPARWAQRPALWAILLTDGVHTLRTPVRNPLPLGTRLAVVNCTGSTADLAPLHPLRFESLSAALGGVIALHAPSMSAQVNHIQGENQ